MTAPNGPVITLTRARLLNPYDRFGARRIAVETWYEVLDDFARHGCIELRWELCFERPTM